MNSRTSSIKRRVIHGYVRGVLLLLVTLGLGSCAGSPESNRESEGTYTECRCGTPEHDVLGCTHECCLGFVHCGNLLCTCPRKDAPEDSGRAVR